MWRELADLPAGRQARRFYNMFYIPMHWYVYILKGKNGILYKGITDDIERRLMQHSMGQSNTTKRMGGFSLIHVEICESRIEARTLEKFFKCGFGREIIKDLFS